MKYNDQKFNIFYKKRKKIIIIRPLLVLNRLQILKVCTFLHLPIYIDSTNQLTNFRRNRLRHQILPLLKIFFNPKIDVVLTRFISIVNSENIYFNNHLKNSKIKMGGFFTLCSSKKVLSKFINFSFQIINF